MNTEQRIQQATIRLVLQHGYDKTTMEDIAQEAGVARSTIYTKWKTKEALFASVMRAEAIRLARKWYALVVVAVKAAMESIHQSRTMPTGHRLSVTLTG